MKLTELFNQELFEYNRNYLLKTYGSKINKIIPEKEAYITNIDELLDEIDEFIRKKYDANTVKILDPYIKWIIDRYSKNNIKNFDEIKLLLQDLLIFDKIKKSKKIPENIPSDINQIKDSDHLKDIVTKISSIKTKREKHKEEEKYIIDNKLAEIIYEDSKIKFVKINDFIASCFYGIGTKWCISMSGENIEKGKSYFDFYSNKGDLYIIFDKYNSKKYLVSFPTKKIRDEKDLSVDIEEFRTKNPYLYEKFLELFKEKLIKYEFIEMLPPNFETLYDDFYLNSLIKRAFFSRPYHIVYDTNILNVFLNNIIDIEKINPKNSEKILNKFSEIFSNYINDKNNQEVFNIHNYYFSFLKRLIESNIKIPEKLKAISKKTLEYYDLEFIPKNYINIVKNL